jgi:hypothetical protein
MKGNLLLALALLALAGLHAQTASAQFPKIPKIPRPGQPKPTPTPEAQPQPSAAVQPAAQPQPETRAASGQAPTAGGPYARKPEATETSMLLPETMEISTRLQDYKWYPNVKFQILYGGEARPRYKAEYFMPNGAPWYSETLEKKWDGPHYLMESAYDSATAAKALPTDGLFGIKITNMRDNSTAFQGKFRVVKYRPETASSPKEADYYVDHDWFLPVGYAEVDYGRDEARPSIRMWFKGGLKTDDFEARLFRDGKQIATTDEGGRVGSAGDRRFPQYAGNNPALFWELIDFSWPSKFIFIVSEDARSYTANDRKMFLNQMPGEYTVKVFYQGEQVRETKFRIADGNFADVGVALPNGLKTYRALLPVRVMGTADKWNPTRWKTDAFYGNPPTGLTP